MGLVKSHPEECASDDPAVPVTLAAVVVLIFIVIWVLLSNLGWIRWLTKNSEEFLAHTTTPKGVAGA